MALSDKNGISGPVNEALAEKIRARVNAECRLPCAVAFVIAAEENQEPLVIGQTADALGIRLTRCQLGLFGYPGHAKGWERLPADTPVAEELRAALWAAATEGAITCQALWELAAQFGVARLFVGYVADQSGLKVVSCQLGAF